MSGDRPGIPGRLHHWLPAVYLARFSSAPARPTRKSVVWVLWRGQRRANRARVETLMRQRDLYADELGVGLDLERNWWAYEEQLPAAIDALVAAQSVSGHDWLRVLVPFAASLLTRGPEFDTRFDRRVESQGGYLGADRMRNAARVMEIQRLLGVVMACRWVVAEAPRPLVANDVGWTSSVDASGRSGVALPLDPGHVLVLTPAREQRILDWDGRRWVANLDREALTPDAAAEWNRMVASRAQRLILGSAASELELLMADLGVDRRPYADPFPEIGGRLRIVHEFEWQRCRAAMHRRPAEIVDFPLDLGRGDRVGWEPPAVVLPTNLPEFPSGLSLEGSSIWLRFNEAPGFTQPPYWPDFGPA